MLRATEETGVPIPPRDPEAALNQLLNEGVTWGDAAAWLPALPKESVDLFFTSPPYADMRDYSRIHPDRYVEWFLPFARSMLAATKRSGSFVLNIKDRVVRGERHPYVFELAIALQHMGWRWIETYIWHKPNAIPGRFGPRTKDSYEYVFWFGREKPYFDLDVIRVPYKTPASEIERREQDSSPRRNTAAGHGRRRAQTWKHGGADPGNVIVVPQTYNQHYGVGHTAAMPEGLAEWVIKAGSRPGSVVIDPFAGSGTTTVVAWRVGRRAGGLELHRDFVEEARARLAARPLDGIAACL